MRRRHVTRVSELADDEAAPEQVYTCLLSHAARTPGHIYWVVQPAATTDIDTLGDFGPALQLAMFRRGVEPDRTELEAFCDRAREIF